MHDDLQHAGFNAFAWPTRRDELEALAAVEMRERQLTMGLVGLANRSSTSGITGYAGWTAGKLPRRLFTALGKALAFPRTLQGALVERKEWLLLVDSRRANSRRRYLQPIHIRARLAALEVLLNEMPDPTSEGIRARLEWLSLSVEGALVSTHETLVMTETLSRDFKAFASSRSCPAVDDDADALRSPRRLQRSNADKQSSVLKLLEAEPHLADREIARRCGVSAPMVGNWRRRRAHPSNF